MLCSNCSKVVRPVVAIDIDGTLGDYHTHLLSFAEGYLANYDTVNHFTYQGERPFGEWFAEVFDVDATTFRQIKLAYRQGGMKRNMPVHSHAAQLVRNVKRRAEVWLTTTRPYLRLDNVDPDTRFWLARNNIGYDGMLYDEDKYKVLADRVEPGRVVSVLDDLIEQVQAAERVFGDTVPIHRMSHWNVREGYYHQTAASLPEADRIINNMIDDWEAEHVGT